MTYDPNTPANINEYRTVWQRKMRNNFVAIKDYQQVDHYEPDFEESDLRGKHRKLSLPAVADPTTASDEQALYQKDVSGTKQLHARNVSSGAIYQLTATNKLNQNGLTLSAAVVFDGNGNILSTTGNSPKQLAYNVASVTIATADKAHYLITFSTVLATDDYLWITQGHNIGAFNTGFFNPARAGLLQVSPNSTYTDVVKTGSLSLQALSSTGVLLDQDTMKQARLSVEIYEVV